MRTRNLMAAISLVAASATPAAAGNHFLLELEGGMSTPLGVEADPDEGVGGTATFGLGGRIPGYAPAYYLVGRVGRGTLGHFGPPRFGRAHVSRTQSEYAVGGRVYLPITERFRVMLQVAAGQVFETATIERGAHDPLALEADRFALFGDGGVQYRITNHFSLGANLGLAWLPREDGPDLPSMAAGIPDPDGAVGRARLGMAATFHF